MLRQFHNWLYPELALFPSETARLAAKRAIQRVSVSTIRVWFVSITLFLVFFPIVTVNRGNNFMAAIVIGSIVAHALGRWTLLLLPRSEVRQALRVCLNQQGVPICLGCGYDLTGNTSGVCSECGELAAQDKMLN